MTESNPNYEALCREVIRITRDVGEFQKEERKNIRRQHLELKGNSELVSYVDKQSEEKLIDELSKLFPRAGFIAEEGTVQRMNEFHNWVIDPLDGTTNYLHGIPMFCISVALIEDEKPMLGVIHDPIHNETFYAWHGGGAWCNGKHIRIARSSPLDESLVVMGFPYDGMGKMGMYLNILSDFNDRSRGLRRLGSAALDLAYVAAGRCDVFFEYGLNPWDVAAGACIVSEAGGKVADFGGGDKHIFGKEIVAGSAANFNDSLEIIGAHWNAVQNGK